MSQATPSLLFTQYTDLFCDQTLEDLFTELFGSPCKAQPCLYGIFRSNVRLCLEPILICFGPIFSWQSLHAQGASTDQQGLAGHQASYWCCHCGEGPPYSKAHVSSPGEEARQSEKEAQQEAAEKAESQRVWWLVRFWWLLLRQQRCHWWHLFRRAGFQKDPHAKCVFFPGRCVGTGSFSFQGYHVFQQNRRLQITLEQWNVILF